MRPDHPVLNRPVPVSHHRGRLKVYGAFPTGPDAEGEALSLDGIVHSVDAELVAKGLSGKGPERGAIVRHGRFTLWGFEGGAEGLTEAGKALFVNTVHYAASHAASPVLERRLHQTRDGPRTYLVLAKTVVPGLLRTLGQYLPETLAGKTAGETETWIAENRPYLFARGRRFEADAFAKSLGLANHTRAFLETCIRQLETDTDAPHALEALARYTGRADLGASAAPWRAWYEENRDFLFFSDCEGFRFLLDEEAKARNIPCETLRGWSSERLDYRADPAAARYKPEDLAWLRRESGRLREAGAGRMAFLLGDALDLLAVLTDYGKPVHEAYAAAQADAGDRTALLARLRDPSEAGRVFAAAFLAVELEFPVDFLFDVLEGDEKAIERAANAAD